MMKKPPIAKKTNVAIRISEVFPEDAGVFCSVTEVISDLLWVESESMRALSSGFRVNEIEPETG